MRAVDEFVVVLVVVASRFDVGMVLDVLVVETSDEVIEKFEDVVDTLLLVVVVVLVV